MTHLSFDDADAALTRLLALRKGYDSAQLVVEWAQLALEQGAESRSLAMLAGLGREPNAFETEELFQAALRELGVGARSPAKLRADYVSLVCTEIAGGSIDAGLGLTELLLVWERDYAEDLTFAVELSDDIMRLDHGEAPLFYPDLSDATVEEIIRREARRWLSAQRVA